jgi:hypothetical protein
MTTTKSYATWVATWVWCQANPGKIAAIVTPKGTFTVKYDPQPEMLRGVEWTSYESP